MIMTVGTSSAAITPELQIVPPRQGEDHARVTERWSVTGVWSYYCTNNEWQMTEGDSCSKASRTGNLKRERARKVENQQLRSKPEDVALAEVESVAAAMHPVIPTDFGRAVVRCTLANSTRQVCIVELADGVNIAATVDLDRLQTGAWFATNVQVTRCRPE
jgi:hypothetical protein